ncbi:FecR domain-containing protein [Fibrobacterota bacterium]
MRAVFLLLSVSSTRLAGAFFLILAGFLASGSARAEQGQLMADVVLVKSVQGKGCLHLDPNTSEWAPLKPGQLLRNNSIIRTGNNSRCRLIFLDGQGILSLDNDSKLMISAENIEKKLIKLIQFTYGTALVEIHSHPASALEIQTASHLLSASKARFLLKYSEKDRVMRLWGIKGRLKILDNDSGDWRNVDAEEYARLSLARKGGKSKTGRNGPPSSGFTITKANERTNNELHKSLALLAWYYTDE